MVQRKTLTHKQEQFVQEYVANGGNGTQAALAVYNTTDPNTAHVIASENLQKPTVAERATELSLQLRTKFADMISTTPAIAIAFSSAQRDAESEDLQTRVAGRKWLLEFAKAFVDVQHVTNVDNRKLTVKLPSR